MALPAQSEKLKFTNLEELEKLVHPPVLSDKECFLLGHT